MSEKSLLYTKEHEWLRIENDFAFVGITGHAQSELGDIIFVEFPDVGDSFEAEDVFGTIEAVKTVADLFMPIESEIVAVNDLLDSEPEMINSDPYGNGWLVKIKIINKSNLDSLLTYEEYNKLI